MNTVNLKSYRLSPETASVLQARARRARAQAMGNLVVRVIRWLSARSSGNAGHPFGIKWG